MGWVAPGGTCGSIAARRRCRARYSQTSPLARTCPPRRFPRCSRHPDTGRRSGLEWAARVRLGDSGVQLSQRFLLLVEAVSRLVGITEREDVERKELGPRRGIRARVIGPAVACHAHPRHALQSFAVERGAVEKSVVAGEGSSIGGGFLLVAEGEERHLVRLAPGGVVDHGDRAER